MELKCYVVIDDDDQTDIMTRQIDNKLRPDGYEVKNFYFNPNDRDYWGENSEPDLEKFATAIKNTTRTFSINVVACDYQYSGVNWNGIDVIRKLREIGIRSPIILYSGNDSKVIQDIFNAPQEDSQKIASLRQLLSCKIEVFISREDYSGEIIKNLRHHYSIEDVIVKKITEYPDVRIKFDSSYMRGKLLSEALTEMCNNGLHSHRFLGELLELAIANFAAMNRNE